MTTLNMVLEAIPYRLETTCSHASERIGDCRLVTREVAFPAESWPRDDAVAPRGDVLACGSVADVAQVLSDNESWLGIALYQQEDVQDLPQAVRERMAVVSLPQADGSPVAVRALHEVVSRVVAAADQWEVTLKRVLLEGGGYQELLDASSHVFQNCIVVSNSEFKLLAHIHAQDTGDPCIDDLIRYGEHPISMIRAFRRLRVTRDWESQEGVVEKPASPVNKYRVLDYVFRVRGSYFVHANMHCFRQDPTPGMADAFSILVEHLAYFVQRDLLEQSPVGQRTVRLFDDLMQQRAHDQDALARRTEQLGFNPQGTFRLFAFALIGEVSDRSLAGLYVKLLMELFEGSLVGPLGDYVLLLDVSDRILPSKRDVMVSFLELYAASVGASEEFHDLCDFPHAFEQAKVALDTARNPQPSLAMRLEPSDGVPLYTFGEYYIHHLFGLSHAEPSLVEFALRDGIVRRVVEFDRVHGTDDTRLLYRYLYHNCSVQLVSEELFVHPNTLRYRIRRMQERFGFDLDDPRDRQRILLEFHLYG